MRIVSFFATVAAMVLIIAAFSGRSQSVQGQETVLSFTSMAGVDDSFLNNTVVRGVMGDELPWDVGTVDGTLTSDGHLHLAVTGVVFSDDPRVPVNLRGINDEDEFRAVVSCLTNGPHQGRGRGHGLVETRNIFTDGFAATRTGDSTIDTFVTLPNPCVAPIVFVVAGSEDKWFTVTGSYEEK